MPPRGQLAAAAAAGVQETGGDLAQQMTERPTTLLPMYGYIRRTGILTLHLGKTEKLFLFPLEEHTLSYT